MTTPREEAKKVVKNYIKAIGDVLKPLLDIEIQSFCPNCGERMETSEHFCDSCKERVTTPTDIDVAPIRKETSKAIFKEIEENVRYCEFCQDETSLCLHREEIEDLKKKWCGIK